MASAGLKYTFCVLDGLASVFTFVTLCLRLIPSHNIHRAIHHGRVHMASEAFSDVFYFCSSVAMLALVVGNDVTGLYDVIQGHLSRSTTCLTGGFFALFGAMQSLVLLAVRTVIFAVWCHKWTIEGADKSNEPEDITASEKNVSHTSLFSCSRALFSYCVCQIVQLLVWAILCFLPLTVQPLIPHLSAGINSTVDNQTGLYFGCISLTLAHEASTSVESWRYSTFLLVVLAWCPVTVSFVGYLLSCYKVCRHSRTSAVYFKCNMLALLPVRLLIEVTLWIAVVIIASVCLLSDGTLLNDTVSAQWTIAYFICILSLWHSAVDAFHSLVVVTHCRGERHSVDTPICFVASEAPDEVTVERKADAYTCNHEQCEGELLYAVKWLDCKSKNHITGLMKVVPTGPAHYRLWQNEIEAIRLLRDGHPNVARYLWTSPSNAFSTAIASVTGDIVGRHSMLVCSEMFNIGSLDLFIESGNTDYCITIIHSILEQIAGGIDFIHSRHLVHNNLTSCCVYIADYNVQFHRVRPVISKFEHSFTMTSLEPPTRSQQATSLPVCSRLAAIDVQSFSLLVTELTVNASQCNRLRCRHAYRSGAGQHTNNNNNTTTKWLSSSGTMLQRLLQLVVNIYADSDVINASSRSSTRSDDIRTASPASRDDSVSRGSSSACSCSTRVTDIRARYGTGSPWQRGGLSDSESSAFRRVATRSLCDETGKQTMTRCRARTAKSSSPVDNRRRHVAEELTTSRIDSNTSHHCCNKFTRTTGNAVFSSRPHGDAGSTTSDVTSGSSTSSAIGGCSRPSRQRFAVTSTFGRTKRRLAAVGELSKTSSSAGLKSISETGSLAGQHGGVDTVSPASCSLCLHMDTLSNISHPALRGIYSTPSGGATTRTGSEGDTSDDSSTSSSSSDSLGNHSFSGESR